MTTRRIAVAAALAGGVALSVPTASPAASCTAGTPRWDCVWHTAKAANPPGGLPCVTTDGTKVCYQRKGDKVWVKDTAADSFSAISKAKFPAFRTEYYCRNKLGKGRWGVCDERLSNGASFYIWGARYDAQSKQFHGPWSEGRDVTA